MHHFESLSAAAEVTAVQSHFRAVLWFLRQRRPPALDEAQKVARALLLDELEAYAARGVFPKNRHFPGERRPTFIDEDGTRCAVAHLLDSSGLGALGLEIQDRMNFAPVSDIAEDTRVVAWLEAVGFTKEEAALIQPSYCDIKRSDCVCMRTYKEGSGAPVALVTYRRKAGVFEITEVHHAVPGVAVGQTLAIQGSQPAGADGAEYLGWVHPSDPDGGRTSALVSDRPFTFTDGQSDTCQSWGATSLPMTKAQAIEALLSPTYKACASYLASLDDTWDDTADCGAGSCDMSSVAASSPASLAVLAAIVGALAARRRLR